MHPRNPRITTDCRGFQFSESSRRFARNGKLLVEIVFFCDNLRNDQRKSAGKNQKEKFAQIHAD